MTDQIASTTEDPERERRVDRSWPAHVQAHGRTRAGDGGASRVTALVAVHGIVSVVGWACLSLSVVLAIVGYVAVSGTADVSEQVNRLAGISVGALALLGIGAALLLSHHYRAALDAVAEMQQAALDDISERP